MGLFKTRPIATGRSLEMDNLIGVIFLQLLGAALAAYPEATERDFRCTPAKHIELQWKHPVPAFICRFGDEEFVLASSDLVKYADNMFDIKVKAQIPLEGSAILRKPLAIVVHRVTPILSGRALLPGYGGSSSSSSYQHYQEHQHHQNVNHQHHGGVAGIGVGGGHGSSLGVGSGSGSGFGVGAGHGSSLGVGAGHGSSLGVGAGSGSGFGIGSGGGSGFGVGSGIGIGVGVGAGFGGGFGVGGGFGGGAGIG